MCKCKRQWPSGSETRKVEESMGKGGVKEKSDGEVEKRVINHNTLLPGNLHVLTKSTGNDTSGCMCLCVCTAGWCHAGLCWVV